MKNNKTNKIIGVDLGDKNNQVCVTDKDGNVLSETKMLNNHQSWVHLLSQYPRSLFAIEVGTHSPWISRLITNNDSTCIVANARKLRAIYQNERKCDKLDALMLAKLARVDPELLSPIEHGTEENQLHGLTLTLRDSLVRQRVNIIATIRGSLKSLGIRLNGCSTPNFSKRCRKELKESALLPLIESSLGVLDSINDQIKAFDKQIIEIITEHYPQALKIQEIAGIGPITSLAYVLTIGDPERFKNNRDVGAYLGLVPRRDQSGESDKQLPISKTGNRTLRRLLVQCSQYILGRFGPESDLRNFGLRMVSKGGKGSKKKATIAVARKLAVLLLTLWKSGETYKPLQNTGNIEPIFEAKVA
jgi:transposase